MLLRNAVTTSGTIGVVAAAFAGGLSVCVSELANYDLLCADFEANKKSFTLNQKITQVVDCVSITRPSRN